MTVTRLRDMGITADPKRDGRLFADQSRSATGRYLGYARRGDPSLPAVYVALAPSGGGGTGAGSMADPYLLSAASAATRGAQLVAYAATVHAALTNGSRLLLHRELASWANRVRVADASSVAMATAFSHLGAWGEGPGRPLLTKYDDWSASWTEVVDADTGQSYYWTSWAGSDKVRIAMGTPETADPWNADRYGADDFVMVGSLARFRKIMQHDLVAVAASAEGDERSRQNLVFVDTGANRLYLFIHGSADPSGVSLQKCEATANIAGVSADGVLFDGVHLEGGSVDADEYVVKNTAGGVGWGMVDCFAGDADAHVAGTAGSNADGSVAFFSGCVFSGGSYHNTAFTHLVAFANDGDVDLIADGCDFLQGSLGPTHTRGQLAISHGSGGNTAGSMVLSNARTKTRGAQSVVAYANTTPEAGEVYGAAMVEKDWDVLGEGSNAPDGTADAVSSADATTAFSIVPFGVFEKIPHGCIRGRVAVRNYQNSSGGEAYAKLTSIARVTAANIDLAVSLPVLSDSGDRARLAWILSGNTVAIDWVGLTLRLDYAGGAQELRCFLDSGTPSQTFTGCLFESVGAGTVVIEQDHDYNAAASSGKGFAHCAFYGIDDDDYGSSTSPVVLSEPVDPDAPVLPSSPLVLAYGDIDPGVMPVCDAHGNPRHPAYPTIGARAATVRGRPAVRGRDPRAVTT
jgi:hypothetical protein